MSDTAVTSSIANEDVFQDIIANERSKRTRKQDDSLFGGLAESIHRALARQDSESTLALITK